MYENLVEMQQLIVYSLATLIFATGTLFAIQNAANSQTNSYNGVLAIDEFLSAARKHQSANCTSLPASVSESTLISSGLLSSNWNRVGFSSAQLNYTIAGLGYAVFAGDSNRLNQILLGGLLQGVSQQGSNLSVMLDTPTLMPGLLNMQSRYTINSCSR